MEKGRGRGEKPQHQKNLHNRELGRRGELAAARYLELMGYEIVDQNWTCPRGEADIVAFDGDCLVFCEVKTRTSTKRGLPCEAVDAQKRHRYENIAIWYLKDHAYVDIPFRFDVIDILVIAEDRAVIRHIANAFGAM